MDKITAEQQAAIKKMSDVRLISKLANAGVVAEKIEKMDRLALINAWAELVATGQDKQAAEAVAVLPKTYDSEVETKKLEFERMRYEEEKRRHDLEKEEEKRRYSIERKEANERHRLEIRMRQEEIELRKQKARDHEMEASRRDEEMRRAAARENRDREKNEAVVAKVKLFGDAMRNSAFKMSNDPLGLLPFFENVECSYQELLVPDNLRVQLLRPYLSERAKVLLTRLDTDIAKDYVKVKEYLLHQFELSPRVFLAKFNTVTRQSDETMVLFSSKLKALLTYYLNSRKVDSVCFIDNC